MSYKDKLSEGIDATGDLTFTEVSNAVSNVVNAMGEKAVEIGSTDEDRQTIMLQLFDTGIRRFTSKTLVGTITSVIAKRPDLLAYVALKQGDDGKATVSVDIGSAATTSSSVMFIPTGTTVHGITTYRDFLDLLTLELRSISPDVTIERR